jgi:hypothetical protein
MRQVRTTRPRGQKWSTFIHTHAQQIWACDFLPVTDLFFRSLFAFFMVELHSRRVIHVGVTRCPTDAWTAQQLREATAYGEGPKYLIRDRDNKFGPCFARVAATREARSSPCQSWVEYTTITAEVLELLRVCDGADGYVVWSAPHRGALRPSFLFAVLH